MVKYNFNNIKIIPNTINFIDIVLSKTQRKTPTVIHSRMKIARIRLFYMRKVKYTQNSFNERLTQIISEFPKLNSIHPFFADMINVLYDKDHYKLALGHINTCRSIINKIGQDYVKFLKYGDSAYRCKQLKRAALGRMVTIMRKQKATLSYLEQVRQHLSRLPQIDPDARTLVLTGFPNVGKSSFINKITRADVEVQDYPFTTKSLFVGHMDYNYLRWQVIDSPGILDRPLEDRNIIEMQTITALAHLNACIIFFINLDPLSKYSIHDQIRLFRSLKPLWIKKPITVVCNKTDLRDINSLTDYEKNELSHLENEGIIKVMSMSNLTKKGIIEVRDFSCNQLLTHRINVKTQTNKIQNIANRIYTAQPTPRDKKCRTPIIVTKKTSERLKLGMEKNEKKLENINGGFGIYNCDLRKYWKLKDDSWRYDVIPEIWNGLNIRDFILKTKMLDELDEIEVENETNNANYVLTKSENLIYDEIKFQKAKQQMKHKSLIAKNAPMRPREIRNRRLSEMENYLEDFGYNLSSFNKRYKTIKDLSIKKNINKNKIKTNTIVGRETNLNKPSIPFKGLNSIRETLISRNILYRSLQKINKLGLDKNTHSIPAKKPKHLNSGKRGIGKTMWR